MNKKVLLLLQCTIKAVLFYVTILLIWLIFLTSKLQLIDVLKFVSPFFLLWFVLTIVSIMIHEMSFTILWSRTIRDDRVFDTPNIWYAMAFLLGAIIIFVIIS